MSYSKIFSDLPELTYDVIKYFKNDFSTLHSCILVNRLWCRLAIPLLWENPFSIPNKNYNFIIIYLHNLNGDLKAQLSKYKIDDKLFPSNALFNYPTFLKYLYTQKIISSIKEWAKDVKLEKGSILGFKRLIHMSLFKIFIENEVNIHTFDIQINFSYIDDMLELMLKNPDFFHNIRNLKLGCIDVLLSHAKNFAPQMINLCQNLKKISLTCNSFPIYQSSFRIIYPLFNLTENLKQNLNHLSIKIFAIEFSSITLQNLGQLLPLKLEYLSLTLIIKYEDFEIFLKNSQNTYIKKLLINYTSEDEVKEFELYNIKIQRYYDLFINSKLKYVEGLEGF
ncbi:unnamed protein product [Rhizophagus irregularis]|nr:unnamed protein product [Rhizophagus irregularis]